MKRLNGEIDLAFCNLTNEKRRKLEARVNRTYNRMNDYFDKKGCVSRERYLALLGWVESLVRAERKLRITEPGTRVVKINHNFRLLLRDMYKGIRKGYEKIGDFSSIDENALNHVLELHKIAVEDGYF